MWRHSWIPIGFSFAAAQALLVWSLRVPGLKGLLPFLFGKAKPLPPVPWWSRWVRSSLRSVWVIGMRRLPDLLLGGMKPVWRSQPWRMWMRLLSRSVVPLQGLEFAEAEAGVERGRVDRSV